MDSVVTPDSPAGSPGADADPRAARTARGRGRYWLWGLVCGGVIALGWEAAYVLLGANFHCVAPGAAYRCAQPSADWLRHVMQQKGIRTVINLRGDNSESAWYVNERQAVLDEGGCFKTVMLSAAFAPEPHVLRHLVRVLDNTPRPVLFHCRSGCDRCGLVATLYLLLYTDTPMADARQQLSVRYGHICFGKSACLQDVLDQYENWLSSQQRAHQPEQLREWIMHVYRKAP